MDFSEEIALPHRMRVLLFMHALSRTGAPIVALSLFEHLRKHIELFTVSIDGGELRPQFEQLGPVRVLADVPGVLGNLPRGVVLRVNGKTLQRKVMAWRPELVYVNSVSSLNCARYINMGAIPSILHVHEMENGLRGYPTRAPHLFFQWPSRYIAVSNASHDSLVQLGVEQIKIEVVHAFIDASQPTKTLSKPSDFDAEPFIIGGAGHISWLKGTELWLLMAAHLLEIIGRERVRFVWVGVGENEDSRLFRFKVRKMGLEDAVELIPVTPNPQEHFARFDVFAITSWEDSCPLVVLENMLLETPVACFAPSGGACEEVGDTGIIIENFDPYAMAQKIAELLRDNVRRRALGVRARHRVLDGFITETQVPKIWNVIQNASDLRSFSLYKAAHYRA